jgi:flagellin
MKEIGDNVLMIEGNPVTGDVYNFTLNGEAIKIELTDDAGSAANFDYKVTIGSGSATTTVTATVDQGKTAAGVADIVAQAINHSSISGNHPGIVASAAANDGSVTVTQTVAITGGYDMGGGGEAAIAKQTSDVTAVVGTGANTGLTFNANDTFKITGEAAYGDSKVTKFTINGTDEISINGTQLAAAGYAKTAIGAAEYIADQLAAKTDLKGLSFRVGTKSNDVYIEVTQTASTLMSSISATPANSSTAVDVTSTSGIDAAIVAIDAAIKKTNNQRASLGSISNRLDNTVSNLTNISSNLQAGRGRIEDADFAAETTNLARTQILQQASTAMLAQANASKQNVLSLLQG